MVEKKKVSIREQIAKLDAAVDWFYSDEFNLEEATEKYQKALELSQAIEQDLLELKNQVEILPEDFTKA